MSNQRRGHYVPSYLKGQDMPVNYNRSGNAERIMPTDTSNRMDVPRQQQDDPNAPMALPSNNNRETAPRPRGNNRTNVNTRAPMRTKKQARIG
mgnify:CR=1 FL=1